MDTRHMRYFMALAETLHFGRAATRVNMSQPPFSRQIAMIEKTLGVRLFDRNSRNVTLTVAGKRFMADCQAVLSQFEAACRDAQLVASGMKGELRLGFMMHTAETIIPRLARLYYEAKPDIRVILDERTPIEIDELLLEGKLDAAVTFRPEQSTSLETVHLATERLRLLLPARHRLADAKTVGPQELRDEKLIAAPATVAPKLHSAITAYFASSGIVPNFRFEPRLQHTIIRLVAEGLGVALIPESLCRDLGDDLSSTFLTDAPEFGIVLCAPIDTNNPAVPPLMALARSLYSV